MTQSDESWSPKSYVSEWGRLIDWMVMTYGLFGVDGYLISLTEGKFRCKSLLTLSAV